MAYFVFLVSPVESSSLSELFKKPTGMWECPTCMIQNKADANKCPACETSKPGMQPAPSTKPVSIEHHISEKTCCSCEYFVLHVIFYIPVLFVFDRPYRRCQPCL